MSLFKKKPKENKVKEEIFNQYWEEHKNSIIEAIDKYDLYRLEPLKEVYNERMLLTNGKQAYCYKYKLLSMWDNKTEKQNVFVLFKSPFCKDYEFSQLESMEELKNWLKSRIELEVNSYGLDNNKIIAGEIEEEFVKVADGHWGVK